MDYLIHILLMVCIYAILGVSFNLILGYTGLIAMCHAAFFGIGAYTASLLGIHYGVSFLVGIAAGMAAAGAIGLLVALPAIRVRDEYLIVTTLALLMIIYTVMMNWVDLTRGAAGLSGIPRPNLLGLEISTPSRFLPLMTAFGAICFLVNRRIVRSPFGRALKAIREDESAALAVGKNVVSFKIRVFVVGGALAAIAGALFAYYTTYISPFYFTLTETIFIFAVVIVGGTANLWGPIVGAALLVTVTEGLRFLNISPLIVGFARQISYGAILILFMCFRPQGLLGEFRRSESSPEDLGEEAEGPHLKRLDPSQAGRLFGKSGNPAGPQAAVLEVEGLSKNFGGIQAVKKCALHIQRGKIVGLIGPNGAGKTTLFNLVTGFIPPDEGRIRWKGRDITRMPPHHVPEVGMARTFQDLRLFGRMSVLDNVLVAFPRQRGERLWWLFFRAGSVSAQERANLQKAEACLRFLGLWDKAQELAEDLSYAEQKLLSLARLLATEAELLLLDEPTSGLDPVFMEGLYPILKELVRHGKTICIVEHNMDVIRAVVDEVIFMNQGEVIARGTPEEIMNTPELAEIYFGG
jgi:ABC-type branched-subunit amino acid transport system ATPase component/ABC-type branched-subunit amino acid transport system permease subunit